MTLATLPVDGPALVGALRGLTGARVLGTTAIRTETGVTTRVLVEDLATGRTLLVEQVEGRSLGARGVSSGREFEPNLAGGPIRELTTDNIRVTTRGIEVVEEHLARFDLDPANQAMIQRLRGIAAGTLEPTPADLNFYAHELREFVRYRRSGWQSGVPNDFDLRHALWDNTHTATLEDYGIRGALQDLYHPDAIRLIGE